MSNEKILKEYYERRYSHQSRGSIERIRILKIPTSRYEAVVKFFPKYFKGGDVLEIGAGNGNVAKTLLSSEIKIFSYTVSEMNLSRLNGIRRNIDDSRISILEIDAENIPKSEHGKYDTVIMVALIEHLIDPLRAMQEIRKLLKPGGFVYIDTPNIAKYTRRIKLLLGRFPSTASSNEGLTTFSNKPTGRYDQGHLHYFTYRSLSLMLTERCGFSRVIKLAYPGGRIPFSKYMHGYFAKLWPELFSELALIAYV